MRRAGLSESLEGTLSFWNGKWRVSYTEDGRGNIGGAGWDYKGDNAPELDPSQVAYAEKNKAVINQNRGMDVDFEIRNGKAFLVDLPVIQEADDQAAERQDIMDKVIPAVSGWLDDAKTLPGFTDSQRLENAIETIAIQICIDVADEFGLLSDMRTRERVRSLANKIKAATSIDQAKQLMVAALQAILDLANSNV